MATLGQRHHNRTLFRGISSFWSRFFNDKDVIGHLFSASDQLMGQIYLELMEVLLANSVKTVPVFSKEFWKLITFKSNEVQVTGEGYKFKLAEKLQDVPFIYNRIFEPTTILEQNKDYKISGTNIFFEKNIFDDLEYPGFAKRRDGNITTITMWAPTAKVDKEYVYEYYGRMLNIYEPSSENYKAFIRGIWFYYMNGPTINRIKSAMNIIGGYPVASEDGEIVLSIREISGIYYVKTTITTYEIENIVDLDVVVGQTLNAFQSLTTAYTVTDYIDDPNWFNRIIVPIEVIPSLSVDERRTNFNDPDPIFIGYPIFIGDERWRIGMGGLPNFMWLLFNGVLKYNIFYVTYDALASKFVRSTEDLNNIVLSGKPAFDLAMVVPYVKLDETVGEFQEEEILMEGDFDLTTTMDLETGVDSNLNHELEYIINSSYGKTPIAFGTSQTQIGAGRIGEPALRLMDYVPELIGTNTIGLTESGLYTEFPLEIIAM